MHNSVIKILQKSGSEYREIFHRDFNTLINSPIDLANAMEYELSRITKTLLLKDKKSERFMITVCSINKILDLNAIAIIAEVKKLTFANSIELFNITKFKRNSVSPLGKFELPIYIDKNLEQFETILIGSGEIGTEIEISPLALIRISKATVKAISKNKE